MINYILHIDGRGGSGKSTLVNALNEELWLVKTANYTTRKPRYDDEPWYHFVTEEIFYEKFKNNDILECYFRKSNKAFYGIPAPIDTSIVQCEIMGHIALRKWCFQNQVPFLSIYLDVNEVTLLRRLQNRSDMNESPETRLKEDEYYEVFKNCSDIVYDYNDKTVEEGMRDILEFMQKHILL